MGIRLAATGGIFPDAVSPAAAVSPGAIHVRQGAVVGVDGQEVQPARL